MRIKSVVSWLISLAMIAAGVALIASFFLASGRESAATNDTDPGGFNVPELGTTEQTEQAAGPEDKTLKLTIPKMDRVDDATIPTASGSDVESLDSNTAVHLEGTGFPWEEEANVYIAGHRLGYPRSESFLAFYDLNVLEDGDEVYVTDASGKKYTYRVFKNITVSPTNLSVTRPVPDKNILTLQSCTLPDYSERLVVQAELVETT
jgi:sortase A